MTHADLADAVDLFPLKNQPALKNYTIYAAMLVHQSLAETRRTLTDYPLYSQMISYVDRTAYSPITHILQLEGGIWKFKLQSAVLMQEKGERQIAFRIIEGHFKGMTGNIYFERFDEKSTLVYLGGSLLGRHWPPTFVIERGAEVVFGFTGRKMRTCIETGKKLSSSPTPQPSSSHAAPKNDSDLPQPRNRL